MLFYTMGLINPKNNTIDEKGKILLITFLICVVLLFLVFSIGRIKGIHDNRLAEDAVQQLLLEMLNKTISNDFKVNLSDNLKLSEIMSKDYSIELIDVDHGGYYAFRVIFDEKEALIITLEKNIDHWVVFIKNR